MKHFIIVLLLVINASVITKGATTTLLTQTELIDIVLKQLNKKSAHIENDLVVSKVIPNNTSETIVVIPEIVEGEKESCCFELNSYILIVDSKTGVIKNNYFESYETNNWVSDAIVLSEITIDTAPYKITDHDRAFGIRVSYYGSSQANPYNSTTISLFIKSKNTLKKVLKDYEVQGFSGEWDTTCYGEFIKEKKTLALSSKKTNNFYDIITNNIITETKSDVDSEGNCQDKNTTTNVKTTLVYKGETYLENNL